MEKNSNDLLGLGIFILIIGLLLACYSFSTYSEVKNLTNKIDFEELDNNNQMPTTEKYYKYLSIADFLNQKLTKNKDILIKNASCTYIDYAYHNAVELYKLTYRKMDSDDAKKSVAAGNIRSLSSMLDYYNTCKQTPDYKSKLEKLLEDIQKANLNSSDTSYQMEKFLDGYQYQPKTLPQDENSLPQSNQPELEPIPGEETIINPQFEQKQ